MKNTPFPIKPSDVAQLTAAEFAFDPEWKNVPSFDEVCQRFSNDVNRALVWLIRFRALKTWSSRDGMSGWLDTGRRRRHICEVAAGFGLNAQWEFDSEAFCQAIDRFSDPQHMNG
jgi:hypothetical protein